MLFWLVWTAALFATSVCNLPCGTLELPAVLSPRGLKTPPLSFSASTDTFSTSNSRSSNNNGSHTQGWTDSPNYRGSLDILWSCMLTIFLCGWTSICVNVPPKGCSRAEKLRRKFLVFCEALAGPEFIFHTALGQYAAACKSVQEFTESGHDGWTVRHGFFADMGGFVLDAPDFVPFPLTASQLHYLVVHGYVDYDRDIKMTKDEIDDKNKFDGVARLLTIVQLGWFVINTIARIALHLTITTLELSTIAFVFCTFFTSICWRDKPSDISCAVYIQPKCTLKQILIEAPAASRPYSYTPMDFARRRCHLFETLWRYCFNIPSYVGVHFHPKERPIRKIWDDQFHFLSLKESAILAFVQFSFVGIHCTAWEFHFPSETEKLMWHICSLYIVCSVLATWISIYGILWLRSWVSGSSLRTSNNLSVGSGDAAATTITPEPETLKSPKLCNNSTNGNPDETIPLFAVLVIVPMGMVYVLARAPCVGLPFCGLECIHSPFLKPYLDV